MGKIKTYFWGRMILLPGSAGHFPATFVLNLAQSTAYSCCGNHDAPHDDACQKRAVFTRAFLHARTNLPAGWQACSAFATN